MTELAGSRVAAVDQLSIQQQADADAFGDGDREQVTDVLGVAAEPELGEGTDVRVVLEHDRHAHRRFEHPPQIDLAPSEIGREDQAAGTIGAARQADAHTLDTHLRVSAPERRHGALQLRHESRRVLRRRPRRLHEEARVDASESHRRGLRPEIHGQNPGLLDIQMQEPRPSSAQGMTHRAFDHPAFFDQLIDDGRDRAPLQPRMPGKIGPRQRLVTPDEIQRDPAVDLSRRFTAGELKARQVDLAHV